MPSVSFIYAFLFMHMFFLSLTLLQGASVTHVVVFPSNPPVLWCPLCVLSWSCPSPLIAIFCCMPFLYYWCNLIIRVLLLALFPLLMLILFPSSFDNLLLLLVLLRVIWNRPALPTKQPAPALPNEKTWRYKLSAHRNCMRGSFSMAIYSRDALALFIYTFTVPINSFLLLCLLSNSLSALTVVEEVSSVW